MEKSMDDYYKILGVDPTADKQTIELAYKHLRNEYLSQMPDRDAHSQLLKLNQAYLALIDPEKRKQDNEIISGKRLVKDAHHNKEIDNHYKIL
jgi:DnaJ-class molecular chaperone